MILSDKSIKELGDIIIRPFKTSNVQPSSYEVHLAGEFKKEASRPDYQGTRHAIRRGEKKWINFENDSFIIGPGEFVLGVTQEKINVLPNMVAEVWGKSSWGRMGLMVHVTAGLLDPSFNGRIVLELKNVSSDAIELRKGDAIAQIVFQRMDGEAQHPYGHKELNSHYQNQEGVVAAKAE